MGDDSAYEIVVVGAGISGLVAANYLAKAGRKVILFDQHYRPGGYCASFRRNGYLFDAAAHSFGSYGEGGKLRDIFRDLGIEEKVTISRSARTDVVYDEGGSRFTLWSDPQRTIAEVAAISPQSEAGFRFFLNDLRDNMQGMLVAFRSSPTIDVVKHYIADQRLISFLGVPFLGDVGVSIGQAASLPGISYLKEKLLDSGYYVEGGMQQLADALLSSFREQGGRAEMRQSVCGISRNGNGHRVMCEGGLTVSCRALLLCIDANTALRIIDNDKVSGRHVETVRNSAVSRSIFMLYFGLQKLPATQTGLIGTSQWVLSEQEKDTPFCMFHVGKDTLTVETFAPYFDRMVWKRLKRHYLAMLRDLMTKRFPDLMEQVGYTETATPLTMNRYTGNRMGAAYGWDKAIGNKSMVAGQLATTPLRNVWIAGHWAGPIHGISGAAISGCSTARVIKRHLK